MSPCALRKMKLQTCTRREALEIMKYLLVTALSLVFSINHAVAARAEIRIVGSPLELHCVQKVAENFALISEFAAPSLEVTGVIGNPAYGTVQRTKSMSI